MPEPGIPSQKTQSWNMQIYLFFGGGWWTCPFCWLIKDQCLWLLPRFVVSLFPQKCTQQYTHIWYHMTTYDYTYIYICTQNHATKSIYLYIYIFYCTHLNKYNYERIMYNVCAYILKVHRSCLLHISAVTPLAVRPKNARTTTWAGTLHPGQWVPQKCWRVRVQIC